MEEKLLILEDNIRTAALFRRILSRLEYGATIYDNAISAKEGFDEIGDAYKLYLLDMRVPINSGEDPNYSAGCMIRSYLIDKKVDPDKIVLMSNGVSRNDEVEAERCGIPVGQLRTKRDLTSEVIRELIQRVG